MREKQTRAVIQLNLNPAVIDGCGIRVIQRSVGRVHLVSRGHHATTLIARHVDGRSCRHANVYATMPVRPSVLYSEGIVVEAIGLFGVGL